MSIAVIPADSYLWCAGKVDNPLPAFPKDWASLYPKYHTWLQDAIRMQVENGVIKEKTNQGVKIYNMTALTKIIGQYDNMKCAINALKALEERDEYTQVTSHILIAFPL